MERYETDKWEAIYVSSGEGVPVSPSPLLRLSVPGGWIVQTLNRIGETAAMCFYPDPDKLWDPPKKK
jgi:hypothetical protein